MTQNKKLVSVIVIVALLGASVAPIYGQGYSGSAVSRGLVAYYPFEGNADDQSGNGNHGTNNGATFVSGVSGGRALELDGKADYVLAPVNINPEVMPQLTMTAWVRPDTASGVVISVDNGGYDRSVHVDNRGGGTGWSAFSGSGGVLGYSPVTIDEWVFLAVVYDQDAETVKLYVNDRVYEEQGRLGSGWEDTYIGKSPSFGAHFSGSIDEVRIYNYALTQSEINALYAGGTTPSVTASPTPSTQPTPALPSRGLVVYYPFDGDARDYSGNGNDGSNYGATFVSGISGGRALQFDGKDDYVSALVNINPDVMPQMTMTAWVRADDDSGTIISHDNGGYDRTIDIDTRGGGFGWSAFSGSGGVLGYYPVTIGEWVFLAAVYDQDAGIVNLYANDVNMYQEKGELGSGWEKFYIGSNPSFGAHFSGTIDEVRIYNHAMSADEIKSLYEKEGSLSPTTRPTSPTPTPTPTTPTPTTPTITPTEFPSLIFESRSKSSGSTIQIPLTLKGVKEDIGNMDMTLSYDPSVLEATRVIKGGLTTNSVFDYNIIGKGTIKISLSMAGREGFSGDRSIAYVRFTIIGSEGSSSPLRIVSVAANRADDMAPVSITTQDGVFTVQGFEEGKGDYTGDGKITAADALGALEMAVGKIPEDLVMDVNGDGKVTSLDVREILRIAVSGEKALTSSTISPAFGGLLKVESEDYELDGASILIPAHAVSENVTISIASSQKLPEGSRFGQIPVGQLFILEPSNLAFDKPATLTLPIPAGEETRNLYIGRWDDENKIWENLGGTIDGDFISTELPHLSTYGLFYANKSTVELVNRQREDTTNLPIAVRYRSGPVPPPNTPAGRPYMPSRPIPAGGVELKQGESWIMELLPGRYHFTVSYPRPQPGVANELLFTVPDLTREQGADDGRIDQTIEIRDYAAISSDRFTSNSIIFPGRNVQPTTNFRPFLDINANIPPGEPVPVFFPPFSAGSSNKNMNIGPIKVEQLQDEGIILTAKVTDPEEGELYYFWSVEIDTQTGIRTLDPGKTESGSTITKKFSRLKAGVYILTLTVYDDVGLFNEGKWIVQVIPNAPPYIDVVVDDRVVDFGRLDGQRRNNPMIPLQLGGIVVTIPPGRPNNHPTPFQSDDPRLPPRLWSPIPNWGVYATPPVPPVPLGVVSSTELKKIVATGVVPGDPTQYPQGMTCVYAIVADADADLIDANFMLLTPLFKRGNFYTAIPQPDYPIGTLIDNYDVMANYNALLTEYANRGWLPCQPHARTAVLPNGNPNPLLPFVAPTGPSRWTYTNVDPTITQVFTKPVRGELPYVVAFNGGSDPQGRGIQEGDVVTEAPNPWGLTPRGTVYKVQVVEGSWAAEDAKGYLWMIPVTDDFWDQRNPNPFATVPALFVGETQKTQIATCSFVGQTLPVIWEAPDDPDAGGQVRDRRLINPDTIPLGGMLNIEARVRDLVGTQQRAFAWVAWPTPLKEEKEADLTITKKDSPDPVQVGDDLTYILTVTNNGPSDATEVVVTDTLPSDVTFVSATPSQGRATESAGGVTWNVGDLVNGASATLTIVVNVSSSAEDESTLTNIASVSATQIDPNTADNSVTETTKVKKEEEDEDEASDEISTSKWYVYHTCDSTGWWCILRYGKFSPEYFSYHTDYTILSSYKTEQELLDAVCGQISDFFCTGGPTTLSPSGPKGTVDGNLFALNHILVADFEEGNFKCPRTYLGAYKCREPQ